jgi:hypothetical protein
MIQVAVIPLKPNVIAYSQRGDKYLDPTLTRGERILLI